MEVLEMVGKKLTDLITGRPIEDWVQDYLDRQKLDEPDPIDVVVRLVTNAFREELAKIKGSLNDQ
jgi:hypothetical protein